MRACAASVGKDSQWSVAAADRTKTEHVISQVGDGRVEPVDRAVDDLARRVGLGLKPRRRVLELKAHAVEGLDDAVMQIHADAVSLLLHRHLLDLLVEAGILDRDRRLCRERAHRLLVIGAEFLGPLLLGQVEVPERRTAIEDRDPEKAPHRRMVRRKAHRARMRVKIAEAKGGVFLLKDTEQTEPVRERSDPSALLVADPGGDELLDESIRVEDAERGVFRARDGTRLFDDALQHDGVSSSDVSDIPAMLSACTWARRCSRARASASSRTACSSSRR